MIHLKRILAVIMVAVLCAGCVFACAEEDMSDRLEGDGFDTPEEAVTYYLEGLKNLDFKQMLRAFAWETQAEHYSVDAKLLRTKAYLPSMKPRLPGDSEFIRTANLFSLRTVQIDAIYQALEYYILQEDYPDANSIYGTKFKEDGEYETFMGKFNNGRLEKLADMTNIRILTPDLVTDGKFSSEKMQANYVRNNAVYGADETVDVPAVADIGDEILFCCPTVARYGEKWYLVSVSSVTSMIIGLDSTMQAFVCAKGSLGDFLP